MDDNKQTIMIVDDESFNIKVLMEALADKYKIVASKNGKQALSRVEKNPPDLILLDIMMPEMDGYEVCRLLKSNEKTRDIPVIFISAMTQMEDEKLGLELGAVDYITKPFHIAIIKARVDTHLMLRLKTMEMIKKNQEMINDLLLAQRIQKKLYYEYHPPSFLNIATHYTPYSYVSGDIYKLYADWLSNYNIFIGDCTGHGVAAALSTIMADVILTQHVGDSPSQIMNNLNHTFEENFQSESLMSGIHVQISQDGLLKTAIAGHPPLIIIPADGGPLVMIENTGTMIGVISDSMFDIQETTYQLKNGDKGILYTDGITEQLNHEGNQYGENRLYRFLQDHASLTPDLLLKQLIDDVNAFSQETPPEDDVSIIAFEYMNDCNS